MTLPTNWAAGNTYGASDVNTLDTAVNALTKAEFGAGTIAYVAAPTAVAATDTANIQAAINSLPAGGGDVYFQSGAYALTATGLTVSNPTRLIGVGAWGPQGYPTYGTLLLSNSTTATGITITAAGCVIENLYVANSGGLTVTSGYGIQFTGASFANPATVYMHHCQVANYFDNVVFTNCCEFLSIADCEILNPVRYGLRIANPTTPDQGDNTIYNTRFITTPAATAAVRLESGGQRFAHSKILGPFVTGVDCAIVPGGLTSDIFVHDNSIESCTGASVSFKQQTPGSGSISQCLVLGNEIQAPGGSTFVYWGQGYSNGIIAENTVSTGGTGITLDNGCGSMSIGINHWNGTSPILNPVAGCTSDLQLLPQHFLGGNILFNSIVTSGSAIVLTLNSPQILQLTGTTAQTVKLATTGVPAGWKQTVINSSSASATVQSSGANTIGTVLAGASADFTALVGTPTTAANWFQK